MKSINEKANEYVSGFHSSIQRMCKESYIDDANYVLEEIENVIKSDRILGHPFPSFEMRYNQITSVIEQQSRIVMTELQLYKFINDHDCEWHWNPDGHLIIFISHYYLKDFCDMLGRHAFDDGGLNCEQHLCADGDVALNEFENFLEDYGIEPENVFPKDEEK